MRKVKGKCVRLYFPKNDDQVTTTELDEAMDSSDNEEEA
jgi:hypothetical protein